MKNRAREIINELNLRQNEIANKIDMTPVGLNQLLNVDMPKIDTLEKIAKAIGVPVWRLCLTDDEIREIRNMDYPESEPSFNCPNCGARLKVTMVNPKDNQNQ